MDFKSIFYFIVVCSAFVACALSYWPGMVSYDIYTSDLSGIRMYFTAFAYSCFGLVILGSISSVMKSLVQLKSYLIFTVCILIGAFLLVMNMELFLGDEYSMIVAFVAFSAGIGLVIDSKYFRWIFFVYCMVAMTVMFAQFKANGIGFEAQSLYILKDKNATSVMWAICAVGLMFFVLRDSWHNLFNIIGIFMMIVLGIGILLAKGRAAFVSMALVMLFMLFKRFLKLTPLNLVIMVLAIVLLGVMMPVLSQFFPNAGTFVLDSFDNKGDDLESFSSGRISRNITAIKDFFENPFFGLSYNGQVSQFTVHNYPLRILSSFGLFGGGAFIISYMVFVWITLKGLFHFDVYEMFPIWSIGFYFAAVNMLISMFEITYPFSPGTVTGIIMFFEGYAIRNLMLSPKMHYGNKMIRQ